MWLVARHEGHSFVLEAEPLDLRVVDCGHLPRLIDDQVSYIWLLEINHRRRGIFLVFLMSDSRVLLW